MTPTLLDLQPALLGLLGLALIMLGAVVTGVPLGLAFWHRHRKIMRRRRTPPLRERLAWLRGRVWP